MRAQVTKLKRASYLEECDAIIREQLEQGVVEKATLPTWLEGKCTRRIALSFVKEQKTLN